MLFVLPARSLCNTLFPPCLQGEFMHNTLQQQKAIVNAMAINEDGVMATGGDNGSLWFWDYKSGNVFQVRGVGCRRAA